MAMALATVFELVVPLAHLDQKVADWVASFGLGEELQSLGPIPQWSWTVFMVIALPQAILHVRKSWRRWVITITAIILTLAWVPILALMSLVPDIVSPMIALVWAAIGSIIYAEKHREPD